MQAQAALRLRHHPHLVNHPRLLVTAILVMMGTQIRDKK